MKYLRQPDLKWIQADAVQLSIKIQPKMVASLLIEKLNFLKLSTSYECQKYLGSTCNDLDYIFLAKTDKIKSKFLNQFTSFQLRITEKQL
jgi:hypothetical protein